MCHQASYSALYLVIGMQVEHADRQSAHAVDRDGAAEQRGHQGGEVSLLHLQPRPRLEPGPGVKPGPGPRADRQLTDAGAPHDQGGDSLLVHARAV